METIDPTTDGGATDSFEDPPAESSEESWDIGRIVYQIEESQSGTAFQAYCPELLVTAFGNSLESAKEALRTQVAQYLEDCDSLGTLDEVLIEAGFYFDGEAWLSNEVYPVKDPKIRMFGTSDTNPLSPFLP